MYFTLVTNANELYKLWNETKVLKNMTLIVSFN